MDGSHMNFQHVVVGETLVTHHAHEFRLNAAFVPHMLPDTVQRFVAPATLVQTLVTSVNQRELVSVQLLPFHETTAGHRYYNDTKTKIKRTRIIRDE